MKKYHGRFMIAVGRLFDEKHVNFEAIFIFYLDTFIWKLVVARLEDEYSRIGWIIWIVQEQVLGAVQYALEKKDKLSIYKVIKKGKND